MPRLSQPPVATTGQQQFILAKALNPARGRAEAIRSNAPIDDSNLRQVGHARCTSQSLLLVGGLIRAE